MNQIDTGNYGELLIAIKQSIRTAQYEALKAVNKKLRDITGTLSG